MQLSWYCKLGNTSDASIYSSAETEKLCSKYCKVLAFWRKHAFFPVLVLLFFFPTWFLFFLLAGYFSRILLFILLGEIFHLKRKVLQAVPKNVACLLVCLICPGPDHSAHIHFSQKHPTSLTALLSSTSQLSSFGFPAELKEADRHIPTAVEHIWNLNHSL